MKKLLLIVASALTFGAFAGSAADPVITADTSAVDPGTTCTVMAGDEEAFDFVTNGGDMTFELDEAYVGRRVCLAVGGEEITDSTTAQMGAANTKLAAIVKMVGEPTPVAVWNGFANLSSGGYTWTNTGCTVDENGVLTIGKTEEGGGLSMEFGESSPIRSGKTLTLALDIETPTFESLSMIANILQAGSNVSIAANGDRIYQCWGTNSGYGDCAWENGTRKTIVITYKGVSNVGDRGTRTYFDGEKKIEKAGLMTGTDFLTKLSIGSYHGVAETGAAIAEGMKVYRAALYDTNLTEDLAKNFTWPNVEIFNGSLPGEADIARFQNESWTGMVWIKNVSNIRDFDFDKYGNANSKLQLTGVTAFLKQGKPAEFAIGEIILADEGETKALTINNGYSDDYAKIKKISGSGTIQQSTNQCQAWWVQDMSEFTGAFTITGTGGTQGLRLVVAEEYPFSGRETPGCLYVGTGKTVTIPAGKEWRFEKTGYIIHGTLNVPSTAPGQALKDDMLIAKGGVVNIERGDWIHYNATADKTVKVIGTLNCGNKRQSFGAHNKLVVVAGATITGAGDGEGAIDNFGGATIKIEAATGDNAPTTVEWSANTRYRSQPDFEVAEGVTVNMSGNVFPETGYTKTVNKTGLGTLNLTGTVAAGITHKLSAGTITSNSATLNVTSGVDGKVIDVKTAEGVTTYTLVDDDTPAMPTVVAGGSPAQQSAYVAWAAANNVTGSTTAVLADAFAVLPNAEGLVNEAAILKAAQDELVEILATIDLTTITAGASFPIEGYPNASFKFVEASLGEGVTTSAKLFKLQVSFAPAN